MSSDDDTSRDPGDDMSRDPGDDTGGIRPPTTDPWKGFRGVMAGTLVLEAIVVLLVLPVIATLGGGLTPLSGGYVIGLAVLMILGAGVQGRSWAIPFNLTLQGLAVLGFVIDPALGAVGVLFALVWAYVLYLRKDIKDREARGLLPGQQG